MSRWLIGSLAVTVLFALVLTAAMAGVMPP